MKYYAIRNKDGSLAFMHCPQQPDGSYASPEDCIAKWTEPQREQVESVDEITRDQMISMRAKRDNG